MTGTVVLRGTTLTLAELVAVAREGARVELDPAAVETMRAGRNRVERALATGETVYGLSTGVGSRRDTAVGAEGQAAFNRMLLGGHRIGQGPAAAEDAVRATMLLAANGLARGHSGARPELAERFVEALNAGEHPSVRVLGSVGVADLAQNADLAHALLGDRDLAAKEGLALLSGNAFSTGLAALAVADLERLLDTFDLAGALDLEAFAANAALLHPAAGEARPYPGLRATLARLAALLDGSFLWAEGTARNLQDPLSYRCLPQVHGAARDALAFARGQLEIELNASQENPLPVPGEDRFVSVGNFDVLPLAAALDFLRIALAPVLTSACERTVKLLQPAHSGLPDGLAERAGTVEEGLAELGVATQALTAEARLLAAPVSFELASTSQAAGIEDRTTMAPLAARRLAEMVSLGERVAAIELVVAAQAVDLRGAEPLGQGHRPRARARPGALPGGRRGREPAGRPRAARRADPDRRAASPRLGERYGRDRGRRSAPRDRGPGARQRLPVTSLDRARLLGRGVPLVGPALLERLLRLLLRHLLRLLRTLHRGLRSCVAEPSASTEDTAGLSRRGGRRRPLRLHPDEALDHGRRPDPLPLQQELARERRAVQLAQREDALGHGAHATRTPARSSVAQCLPRGAGREPPAR